MKIKVLENKKALKVKNVEIKKPTAREYKQANRMAKNDDDLNFALISVCCSFDGQNLPPEEIQNLPQEDYLKLVEAVLGKSLLKLAQEALIK